MSLSALKIPSNFNLPQFTVIKHIDGDTFTKRSTRQLERIICPNIKYLRHKSGLSFRRAEQVSIYLNWRLSKETLMMAERRLPKLKTVFKIAVFYNVPFADLLTVDLKLRDEQAAITAEAEEKLKSEVLSKTDFISPL